MTYFDKQGNEIGRTAWAMLVGADAAYVGDDTIDGFTVVTKFWGTDRARWRSFVRDQDGEEVDGAEYPTLSLAIDGHHDLCEALREMAIDGGRA